MRARVPTQAPERLLAGPDLPVLDHAVVGKRIGLLGELQAGLRQLGVQAVLARNHRIVLSSAAPNWSPSGMTDPVLHVFADSGTRKVTTDETSFQVEDGDAYPAADAPAAAAHIAGTPAQPPA